jgi:hypothetical protein
MNVESNGQRYLGNETRIKSAIANRNRKSSLRLFHNKQNKRKQFLFVSYI